MSKKVSKLFIPVLEELDSMSKCPICTENFFTKQISQCKNGHVICIDCFEKIDSKKCPQCRQSLNSRSLVLEKLMEIHPISCQFQGCRMKVLPEDYQRHLKVCKFREDLRGDPKAESLFESTKIGDLETVKVLRRNKKLKNPIIEEDSEGNPWSVLHSAAYFGHLNIVKFVLDKNPDLKFVNRTPIHLAAFKGNLGILEFLGFKLTNPNPPDQNGQTPFHCAALKGHLDIVKYYLDTLEDKNPRILKLDQFKGRTPLHFAAQNGHLHICEEIWIHLEDKNPPDQFGYTPLHLAANNGHLEIVKRILPDIQDKNPKSKAKWNFWTPLHLAAKKGHFKVVSYIVKNANCDLNVKDKHGNSAFDLASERSHSEVVQLLKKYKPSLIEEVSRRIQEVLVL